MVNAGSDMDPARTLETLIQTAANKLKELASWDAKVGSWDAVTRAIDILVASARHEAYVLAWETVTDDVWAGPKSAMLLQPPD